jgi:hypothetical protein
MFDEVAMTQPRARTDDDNRLPPTQAGLEEQETRIGVERPVDNPVPLDDAPAAPLTAPDETKGG